MLCGRNRLYFANRTSHPFHNFISYLILVENLLSAHRLSQFDFVIKHGKGSTMSVSDALSRSVNEISVLDVSTFKPDKWYISMVNKVKNISDNYPSFKVENNIFFKHVFNSSYMICVSVLKHT